MTLPMSEQREMLGNEDSAELGLDCSGLHRTVERTEHTCCPILTQQDSCRASTPSSSTGHPPCSVMEDSVR